MGCAQHALQGTALYSLTHACHTTARVGASQHAMAEDISAGVTDQMFALNTIGPIKLARAALVHMLRRKRGRMVVIASMAAKVPTPGQAVYSGESRGRPVTDSIAVHIAISRLLYHWSDLIGRI